ncbi:MAG: helix-turn-helix transcriptional regulator [Clostridia bacterium]|nr:helix-turn-helix transcriptional regulator [Clostridia bacterium]
MLKTIGSRIQEMRKKKGLTQEELAERMDISPHYLSALERGVYNIKLTLLVNILNTLGCSADEVFEDVVDCSVKTKANRLSDMVDALPPKEQQRIYEVVEALVKNASK